MSEIDGSDTIKIMGARISRRIIPWMIGFIVVMTVIAYLFFGGSDYDPAEARKQQHDDKVTQAEKTATAGTEDAGRDFLVKQKEEIEQKKRDDAEKKRKADEALAAMMGSKVDLPLPAAGKVDPVELERLRIAREAALSRPNSDESSKDDGFYEDYSNGVSAGKFLPGAGLRDSESQSQQRVATSTNPPEMQKLLDDQKKRETEVSNRRDATMKAASAANAVPQKKKPEDQITDAEWQQNKAGSIGTSSPIYPTRVESRHVLFEGVAIPCVLEGEINSELPGRINCRVVMDTYDSIYGTSLLIPKGSRVMGEYNNSIKEGQDRLQIAFSRIILSNGRSVKLPAMEGSDEMGRAGIEGDLDTRFWKMFGPSFLIAGITQVFKPAPNVTVNTNGGGSTYMDATGQILTDVSKKIIGRYENAKPILRIEKGTRMNIVVTRDIAIPPEGGVAWDAAGMHEGKNAR